MPRPALVAHTDALGHGNAVRTNRSEVTTLATTLATIPACTALAPTRADAHGQASDAQATRRPACTTAASTIAAATDPPSIIATPFITTAAGVGTSVLARV